MLADIESDGVGEGEGPAIVVEDSLTYVLIPVIVDKDICDEAVDCLVGLCEISCENTGVLAGLCEISCENTGLLAATNVDASIPALDAIELFERDETLLVVDESGNVSGNDEDSEIVFKAVSDVVDSTDTEVTMSAGPSVTILLLNIVIDKMLDIAVTSN